VYDRVCSGSTTSSPQTPTRRSVRILAKQLRQQESVINTEEHLPTTPQRGERKSMTKLVGSVVTPSQISVHSHFIDSRLLSAADAATDADQSPGRKSPSRSPSRRDVTETVRRSPRLMARQDNLLLMSPSASTSTVCPVCTSDSVLTAANKLLLNVCLWKARFLARDVIYTSLVYATMSLSVCLSVCLSICDGSALAHYS